MKRKGFTLVELLIVIVVIGILSAMMMLSSTEAVTSARASNIVSNLRNLKTAALSLYTDNLDKADAGTFITGDAVITSTTPENTTADTNKMVAVIKYMNNASVKEYVNYGIIPIANKGWFVYCMNISDPRVQEKLAGRANSVGLSGADGAANLKLTTETNGVFVKGNTVAGMWVVQPATLVTASE